MLDACLDPALASGSPSSPDAARVDAGIFFSGIVIPLRLAGVDVDVTPARAP